jgi:hypothetical protein
MIFWNIIFSLRESRIEGWGFNFLDFFLKCTFKSLFKNENSV